MGNLVDNETLVKRYLREIRRVGQETFEADTLSKLKAAEMDGEVVSTGTMDENVALRRSAVPIEARVAAAEQALEHFENGPEPGGRTVLIDRSCDITRG